MLNLLIENINHDGEGIARNKGKVVFIPFTIVGEQVNVEIVEDKKYYSRGILKEIVTKSSHRIEAKCPYYYNCGGCSYQHMAYEMQTSLKQKIVQNTFKRIGGIDFEVKELIGMQKPWNYRNKVTWHLVEEQKSIKMGFYRMRSNILIDIQQCTLLKPVLNEVSHIIREMIHELKIGEKSSIMIRHSNDLNKVMIEFINCIPGKNLLKKLSGKAHSIYLQQRGSSKLLFGEKGLTQRTGHSTFILGPHDFFQINPEQNEKLIHLVRQYLDLSGTEKVLDAYCGVGTFSINIARDAFRVLGIDSNLQAINNAINNTLLNNIRNCQFIAGSCEHVLVNLKTRFNRIIVDPPRAGLKEAFIRSILSVCPKIIVYISCNPSTLARDIKQFILNDYKLIDIQPLDMFPQTSNIENIVLLQKI